MSDLPEILRSASGVRSDGDAKHMLRAASELDRLRRELEEMKVWAERAEAELSENGKPAMTDRESRCIVCDGRLAKDNFCGKCGVRTRPTASMSPREERLVEAASIAVKYLDALDKGQVFRPDEPTSVWGHLRSALADYDDGSEHPTRPKVRAE